MEEPTAQKWRCSRASLIFTPLTLSFRAFDGGFIAGHESRTRGSGHEPLDDFHWSGSTEKRCENKSVTLEIHIMTSQSALMTEVTSSQLL